MEMVCVDSQVPQLLRDKQFEIALSLTRSSFGDDPMDNKNQRIQQIKILYAFDLFAIRKFKEAMDVFYQLDVDPSHVIGLFYELLPPEFRNRISYPGEVPVLQGRELENGILALVEYLTQVRHRLQGMSSKAKLSPLAITKASSIITSRNHLLQV